MPGPGWKRSRALSGREHARRAILQSMEVSAGDRRRMAALANDLKAIERDEPASPEALAAAIAEADRDRERWGIPPIARVYHPPEEEFYRRARALGLRRSRG